MHNTTCVFLKVPLGVILKSEQKLDDMVQIMEELQQYVPLVTTTYDYNVVGRANPVSVKLDDFHYVLFGKCLFQPAPE